MIETRDLKTFGFGLILVAILSIGMALNALLTVGLLVILLAAAMSTVYRRRLPILFLSVATCLLAGYMFLNRGFAHFGVPPIYVGEVVLVVGLFAAVLTGRWVHSLRLPLGWLIMIFVFWGAARTAPYSEAYGFDALRDGVVWGYAAYAVVLAVFFVRAEWLVRIPAVARRLIPWFVIWVPIVTIIRQLFPDTIATVPNTDVSVLHLKSGDAAAHLVGIAAFWLLGMHRNRNNGVDALLSLKEWGWWAIWLAAFVLVSNRAGLVAVLVVVAFLILVRPYSHWGKLAATILIAFSVSLAVDFEVSVGEGRTVAPQHLVERLHSVVTTSEEARLENTRQWRLQWWGDIISYTFVGDYFWFGKGYGINLATADGYQVLGDDSLRSPHNGHLNILARSGVPGFSLWVVLQVVFFISMLRTYYRARRHGYDWWSRFTLWILAYWLGFMVNMSFDVFLEGPQGGIWFWSVFGFGIANLVVQRDLKPRHHVLLETQ